MQQLRSALDPRASSTISSTSHSLANWMWLMKTVLVVQQCGWWSFGKARDYLVVDVQRHCHEPTDIHSSAPLIRAIIPDDLAVYHWASLETHSTFCCQMQLALTVAAIIWASSEQFELTNQTHTHTSKSLPTTSQLLTSSHTGFQCIALSRWTW